MLMRDQGLRQSTTVSISDIDTSPQGPIFLISNFWEVPSKESPSNLGHPVMRGGSPETPPAPVVPKRFREPATVISYKLRSQVLRRGGCYRNLITRMKVSLTGFFVSHSRDPRVSRGETVSTYLDRKSTRLNSSHTVISYA